MGRELLAGWGRTAPTAADVTHPTGDGDVVAALAGARTRGVIARGLGRSYGDAAQNAGGTVVSTLGLASVRWVDQAAGLVVAAAGASLGDVLRFLVPAGWCLPVLPGTRHVTVGGAVAADVHGKNHPRAGSFARHVVALTVALPGHDVRHVTPAGDPELFWATTGGLGLTGVVLDATLQAVPVETATARVVTRRAGDLDDLMATMACEDGRYAYAVAWLDGLAPGRATGRGVLSRGDHAAASDLPPRLRAAPRDTRRGRAVAFPEWLPAAPPPATAVAALNRLRYLRAPATDVSTLEPLDRFFFPLDAVEGWNRVYGRRGLVQYQFVVPFSAADLVRVALERLRDAGCPPLLAVLKRLGRGTPGPLSFPMPGWTLALDFPAARPGLAGVLDELDALVAEAGGRVYLAKDGRLRPELLQAMYPHLDRWRETKAAVDPDGVLTSDLGRRLGLVAAPHRALAGWGPG